MTADPASRSQPTGSQPPTSAPVNDELSGTDLLLPRWGSSGITVDHIEALLDAALAAVAAPPLHDISRTALYGWLRDVQAGLVSRREQLWMERRVTEAFHAERKSAEAIERTRRAVRHRKDAAEMRRAGTWWADKDTSRRARRPLGSASMTSPGNGIAAEQSQRGSGWANTLERFSHHKRVVTFAAELLALSRSTVYELIWQGELQPVHIGRSVRLTHDELQSFVARQVARADQQT